MISIINRAISLWLCWRATEAAFDIGYDDDSDLTHFVTRPELKAPLFNVQEHDADAVTPGYWFIGPYVYIMQDSHARKYYQPCQTGPHIYDHRGELVWSGACLVRNQNTCDFRVFEANGTQHLSALLYSYEDDTKGHGIVMDSSYRTVANVYAPAAITSFNMHEFNVINNGERALHLLYRADYVETTEVTNETEAGWVGNVGFREVDIATKTTLFEWWALDHISLTESNVEITGLDGPPPKAWNWFHGNSIEKNSDGDYLLSARFTDCIYKISGKDGSVLWRLGGARSSFVLENFNFSRQHDARWLSHSAGAETISFLDNASDATNQTSSISSALIVELDKTSQPMIAHVTKRWTRPDGQLSRLRGNMQTLSNGNVFVGWSDNSYISEHADDGRVLMEARFQSKRFVTYRAYKFNFTGNPVELPTLKAFVFGTSAAASTTVFYVSWNGATEVAFWRFYRGNNETTGMPALIGEKKRTGFETVFQSTGYEPIVYAEAVAADGTALGMSSLTNVGMPSEWHDTDGTGETAIDDRPTYSDGLHELTKTEL